jgi:peptidoglycan/LPS O-acetylase OafA/YrhL
MRKLLNCDGHQNNLNYIRLFLSVLVIFSHSFPLTLGPNNHDPLKEFSRGQVSFGDLAVNAFFLISGMLIVASWLKSKSPQEFLLKRVLRIYPAFIVALLFSGITVWIFCPQFRSGVGNGFSWSFMLLKDCILLTYNSNSWWAGIFSSNPFPGAANGSLWTIQKEFYCYLLVIGIGLLCIFKHRIFVSISFLIIFYQYSNDLLSGNYVSHSYIRFFTYFLLGINIYLWRDKIYISGYCALLCLVILFVSSQITPYFLILIPILGGYLLLWIGYSSFKFDFLLLWTRKTDISYGVYLYAFPIQQVISMHENLRNPWLNFIIATPVTILLAWLSWIFIEKKFMEYKKIRLFDFDPALASPSSNYHRSI